MPVDTGQAKGSVQAAIGTPAGGEGTKDDSPRGRTQEAIERAQGPISAPSSNIFYFTTNLPYVKYLEDGPRSDQAPQGMFKISAIQLKEHIRETIRNAST